MEGPPLGLSLLGVCGVAALVTINAYFVATEFALVAVRRTQVDLWVAEGRRGADAVKSAIEHLDDAIAATQLGITLASLGLGWIGEPIVAQMLARLFVTVGIESSAATHGIAFGIAFAMITFVHVVVGELAPKAIALDHPGRVALFCARPLLVFGGVFRYVLALMNGAGNGLVRLIGVQPSGHLHDAHSTAELSMLVTEARAAGMIRPYSGRILANVFRMTTTRVRDVMVRREDVLAVPLDIEPEDLLDLLRESGFTRLPVYRDDPGQIVGILHTKDLFHLYAQSRLVVLNDAIRPAIDIRPDLPVVDALRHFRRGRRHLSIVRERGGPVLGVCTLEDVLEEIVGEIEDEHDVPTPAGSD